jgi:two-component system OmpR family sensor kinase
LGDEARLRQVLGSLVANALPPQNPRRLRVSTDKDEAIIEVCDGDQG